MQVCSIPRNEGLIGYIDYSVTFRNSYAAYIYPRLSDW